MAARSEDRLLACLSACLLWLLARSLACFAIQKDGRADRHAHPQSWLHWLYLGGKENSKQYVPNNRRHR